MALQEKWERTKLQVSQVHSNIWANNENAQNAHCGGSVSCGSGSTCSVCMFTAGTRSKDALQQLKQLLSASSRAAVCSLKPVLQHLANTVGQRIDQRNTAIKNVR
jgi:hypothetical protein